LKEKIREKGNEKNAGKQILEEHCWRWVVREKKRSVFEENGYHIDGGLDGADVFQ